MLAGAPLAVATMAEIRETVAAVVRRWCPSVSAARRAVEAAWFAPDPVATAVPTAMCRRCSRSAGVRAADRRRDDRRPGADRGDLRGLGVRGEVAAIACGDDGVGVKPDPAMLLALCQATGVRPARAAMIGDTPADLAMGRAAGAGRVVAVLSGVGSREELAPLADAVLGSVGELIVAG